MHVAGGPRRADEPASKCRVLPPVALSEGRENAGHLYRCALSRLVRGEGWGGTGINVSLTLLVFELLL